MRETIHDRPRDRVKEMEEELLRLSARFILSQHTRCPGREIGQGDPKLQMEYVRLHAKWVHAKRQLAMAI
jgi:hypothetical protein